MATAYAEIETKISPERVKLVWCFAFICSTTILKWISFVRVMSCHQYIQRTISFLRITYSAVHCQLGSLSESEWNVKAEQTFRWWWWAKGRKPWRFESLLNYKCISEPSSLIYPWRYIEWLAKWRSQNFYFL